MENNNEIREEEYNRIMSGMGSMTLNQLIQAHKMLAGKSCKTYYETIKDCGVEFLEELFNLDWGRTIIYHYSTGAQEFFKSEYLSDYFKESIKKLLSQEELSDVVNNALNSDKLINDMSEEEIKAIRSSIHDFYNNSDPEEPNISGYFISLVYKLDGKGAISYMKNTIDNSSLASRILLTTGLNDRASYYSGRGVIYGDLNEEHLVEIFNKLLKIDQNYAVEFVKMVMSMKTLGATEFITSFENFARNNFVLEPSPIDNKNISLDGVYGDARFSMASIALGLTRIRGNDMDYQISVSEDMKESFISSIRDILNRINPDVYNEYEDYEAPYSRNISLYR